jgi:uncharacterized protein (DUF2236 family)
MASTRAAARTGGYFDDHSMVRRVHREKVVALCGGRALLMMAAHPVAFAGFFAHTGSLQAPYARLARTARVLDLIAFGSRVESDAATRRVRAMHRRVHGALAEPVGIFPAGTPYAGDDPALLLWILACLADSALLVYSTYVRELSPAEREAYWRDQLIVGRRFGLRKRDMPATVADFDAYLRDVVGSDQLHLSEQARELGTSVVMRPPVGLRRRPLLELVNFITVGLLPRPIRRMYRFSWDPARELALRGGAEWTRRVLVPLLPERVRLKELARAA